jgi:hypothetical protein
VTWCVFVQAVGKSIQRQKPTFEEKLPFEASWNHGGKCLGTRKRCFCRDSKHTFIISNKLFCNVFDLEFVFVFCHIWIHNVMMNPPREISWQCGYVGTMILKVDGIASTKPGKAGFGSLVRNHKVSFQFAFYE